MIRAWIAAAARWVLRREIAELRRMESARREFVANVSHEIRTPLASIKAYAETLNAGPLPEAERAEFLAEIERNADRLARLADDLLTLSALESAAPPTPEPVALGKIAAEVVATLKPLAARKNLVIRVEPFHDIPPVRGHRGRLKQVLTNLLDNAVKFTGEGGTVRLSASARVGRVELVVEDNGVGIPPEDLPRVFDRFYRADKARSRESGGAGLGLAIAKSIVESHAGTLSVDSQPGRGSRFRVSLPQSSDKGNC